MLALRQRAACVARRTQSRRTRNLRSYASESHSSASHGHAPPVEESMGSGFYIAIGAVPAAILVYSLAQPSKDGERTGLGKLIDNFSDLGKHWETRNSLHTAAIEQAAHDRHLFYNVERNKHIELRFPEVFQNSSSLNVPAGHSINLDQVIAHYTKQRLDEDERQAKKAGIKKSQE